MLECSEMLSKLNKEEALILQNRIYISRTIKVFEIKAVAKSFDVSIGTLYRYTDEHYREVSRESSRKQTELIREKRSLLCQYGHPLKKHSRCKSCTCLLHEEGSYCEFCIDIYHLVNSISHGETFNKAA